MSQKDTLRLSDILEMPRADRPRKYRITEILAEKPLKLQRLLYCRMMERLDISSTHLQRCANYRVGEKNALNSDQLRVIANTLGCSVDDLYQDRYTIIDDTTSPSPELQQAAAALQNREI